MRAGIFTGIQSMLLCRSKVNASGMFYK